LLLPTEGRRRRCALRFIYTGGVVSWRRRGGCVEVDVQSTMSVS
jgi:hypothetical protein